MEAGARDSVTRATRTRAAHLGRSGAAPDPRRGAGAVSRARLRRDLDAGRRRPAGVTKPVIYSAFESRRPSSAPCCGARRSGSWTRSPPRFEGVDLADPEQTLVDGFTAFLRAVAASPGVYRLIFLGRAAATPPLGERVRAGREAPGPGAGDAGPGLARGARRRQTPRTSISSPACSARPWSALAEAGARLLLASPETWTPETLGAKLGRLAMRGQEAL